MAHGASPAGKEADYFLKWSFADLLVSSFQTGATSSEIPVEQVSFDFSKIECRVQDAGAGRELYARIKAGWDLPPGVAPSARRFIARTHAMRPALVMATTIVRASRQPGA